MDNSTNDKNSFIQPQLRALLAKEVKEKELTFESSVSCLLHRCVTFC